MYSKEIEPYVSKFAGRLISSLTEQELEEEARAVNAYTKELEEAYIEPTNRPVFPYNTCCNCGKVLMHICYNCDPH